MSNADQFVKWIKAAQATDLTVATGAILGAETVVSAQIAEQQALEELVDDPTLFDPQSPNYVGNEDNEGTIGS